MLATFQARVGARLSAVQIPRARLNVSSALEGAQAIQRLWIVRGRLAVNEAKPLPEFEAFAIPSGTIEGLGLLECVIVVIRLEGRDIRPIRS